MPATDYEQLARVYDALVTAADDVPFFLEEARRAGGDVVEIMAGTGRVSLPLATAGIPLTCVDVSPAMLARLRRKLADRGATADVVQQSAAALDLGRRYALAFVAFHSFEELVQDAERRDALVRIREHLAPGGRFVCTLHDPAVRLRAVDPDREQRWRFRDPDFEREIELALRTAYDPGARCVRGRERLTVPATGEVLADLTLCFRLTGQAEFRALAEACGYGVDALYGGYDRSPYVEGTSPTMIWCLT